jgi:hypothetical protein
MICPYNEVDDEEMQFFLRAQESTIEKSSITTIEHISDIFK